jgi:hypothetical protein
MKFKKNVIILISTLLCIIYSCKKGDKDPIFSFHSRKARLVGEWKVSYEEGTQIIDNVQTNYIFDGNTKKTTEIVDNQENPKPDENYNETYNFKKDGTYMNNIKYENNVSKLIDIDGDWRFLLKNKSENLKNKEAIHLSETRRITMCDTCDTEIIFETNWGTQTWRIEKLSKNEIILNYERAGGAYSDVKRTILSK